ncbi:MAG: MJ1255/VC2487 family glycosyltransferase [Myxococcales bacterium]
MRILYGVVGEGMGHAIRSGVVLDELAKRHDVQVVVSGRAHDYLSKKIGPHLDVKKIWGLTIVTEDNEVRNFKTLLENLKGAVTGWPENIRAYFDVADRFRPDVVVSDFETWSYLFGVNRGIPVVSVDNMQIINRCRHDDAILKGHEADFQLAKAVVKAKLPGAFHYLVTTFFYPEVRKEKTTLHPPILRPEILGAKSEQGEHLLVYQTYTTNEELPAILQGLGRECRVYGLRRGLAEPVREGNLVYMPFSESVFIDDLRTARAVIAGGGFTLMGEAVYLRKPVLSEPVGKQFEQVLNGRYLESLGYGLCAEPIGEERVHAFLDQLPRFEQALAGYSQDGNQSLFAKLEEVLAEATAR